MKIGNSLKLKCGNSLYVNLTNKLSGELSYTNHAARRSVWDEMATLSSDKIYQLRIFIHRSMRWR
jgi:hypothetical protein